MAHNYTPRAEVCYCYFGLGTPSPAAPPPQVDFLLKLAGLEDVIQQDVDYDHEFRITGLVNGAMAAMVRVRVRVAELQYVVL